MSMRPNGWSWIRNFHISWMRVRTKLTDVRTIVFELRFLPYEWARPDGNLRRPDGCINLPLFELWKENMKLIDHWTSSGRAAETSGWMQAGTEASWCSEGSRLKSTSSEWMILGLLGVRTVGTVDRWASGRDDMSSGRLGREPTYLSCRIFWNTSA
jgi:hypothetical protein